MSDFYIKDIKFTALLKLFDKRIFAVPELQREFVWNAKKACSLLDSIYKNYPIGTAMVWETSSRYGFQLRHKLHVLPQFDAESNKEVYFIIDGQQRLSVLYHITTGNTVTNSFGRQINFHNIYFHIDNSAENYFYYYPRRPPSEDYYSVPDILSHRYRSRFRSIGVRKFNAIQECRDKILSYYFPIIFVSADDIDDIRETFIRINSQGTPISAADRAFARAESINLRHHLHEVRNGFENGFSEIDYDTLFMSLLLIYGETQLGERARNRVVKKLEEGNGDVKDFSREWRRIRLSLNKSITYLTNDLHIINFQYLPSKNIIPLLSLFFFHNRNKRPNPNQKRQIHKWFWYSSLSQRYSGRGYSQNILSDAVFFRRLGSSGRGRFSIEEPLSPYDILNTKYGKRTIVETAFYCLLLRYFPRYIEDGESIPQAVYSDFSNRKNKHHIFASALLNGKVPRNRINSLCNICFIVAQENQSFGKKKPSVYLAELGHRRFCGKVLKSHLLPTDRSSLLWTDSIKRKLYMEFLYERLEIICKSFESVAGAKLFRKD